MKLFLADTETGGLDAAKHSILSFAGVVWDSGTVTDTIDFLIRESNIVVEPKAMAINKLDLSVIQAYGISPINAARNLDLFLTHHFGRISYSNRIPLAGQNVGFDVGFMRRFYRQARMPKYYEQRFSHRTVDTSTIMRFLYLQGKLPFWDASLDNGLRHFGIHVPKEQRHTALGDALATAKLLTKLVQLD
jgi:DNA polymerase III epsilon subunit-like protein